MKTEGLFAKKITLKLKNDEFDLITRATKPVSKPLQLASDIYPLVDELLVAEQPITLRLIGVSASQFINNTQASLLSKFLGTKSTEESSASSVAICPVCNERLVGKAFSINKHLDDCLVQAAKEQKSPAIELKDKTFNSNFIVADTSGYFACPVGLDPEVWADLPENIKSELSATKASPLKFEKIKDQTGAAKKGKTFKSAVVSSTSVSIKTFFDRK
jgi:hypothetical protein